MKFYEKYLMEQKVRGGEFIVKQNPKDKLWYVLGTVGKYYMPISSGYTDKKKALAYMKMMPAVHREMKTLAGQV